MPSSKIVVVGSCMIDFVSYTPRLPKAGETIHGSKFVTNFGGKGANQCVAAAKLGATTTLIARVGNDMWGPKYIDNLKSQNVDTKYVKLTKDCSSGIAQIHVSDDGMNQIVIVAGANNQLSVEDINAAKNVIENAEVLVLQLETPVKTTIRTLQVAKGVSILNGAPALAEYPEELLKLPTIFCVNEHEAEIFSNLPVNSIKEAELAARALISKGCQNVLITLGCDGAIYITNDPEKPIFKAKAPKVTSVDSTGAGDAFIGALSYCLSTYKDVGIEKCIQAACIIAADSVTRLGTQISFPESKILDTIKNVLC